LWEANKITKETVLVVGLGEIGNTVFTLLKENSEKFSVFGVDLEISKMAALNQSSTNLPKVVDTMHICLPCLDPGRFSTVVAKYANQYCPRLIIVDSTVPPGTTMKVYDQCKCLVAHSPSRGVHKSPEHMIWEFKRWTKYVGGADIESAEAAQSHFEKMHLKVKTLKSCTETELAKLFETTYRAWMITCFQEMHRISTHFKTDFDDVADFLEDTHRVRFDRPVMFPGVIGGHCLIPNTELLLKSYDSEFLRLILKSNQKRKEEITNPKTQKEAAKIAARVEKLETELNEKNS
jgi:UDP-N-acetyl-D-mannosaminuronate dehydrogenase